MNLDQQIATEIERLAQKGARSIGKKWARQMMAEMREAAEAKQRARKDDQRQRFELGLLVARCELLEWDRAEIAGMLLDGKRHAEESTTMRLAYRKRGEVFLNRLPSESVH